MILSFFLILVSFVSNIRENSWELGVLRAVGLNKVYEWERLFLLGLNYKNLHLWSHLFNFCFWITWNSHWHSCCSDADITDVDVHWTAFCFHLPYLHVSSYVHWWILYCTLWKLFCNSRNKKQKYFFDIKRPLMNNIKIID